jgi:hypothetical protein
MCQMTCSSATAVPRQACLRREPALGGGEPIPLHGGGGRGECARLVVATHVETDSNV